MGLRWSAADGLETHVALHLRTKRSTVEEKCTAVYVTVRAAQFIEIPSKPQRGLERYLSFDSIIMK